MARPTNRSRGNTEETETTDISRSRGNTAETVTKPTDRSTRSRDRASTSTVNVEPHNIGRMTQVSSTQLMVSPIYPAKSRGSY